MVQKKAPDKQGSSAEPNRNHAKPEKRRHSYQNQQQQHHHHQQDGGGGGGGVSGGDLKKMLKKSRSIKVLEESLESPLGTQLVQLGKPPAQKKKKRPSPLGSPNYMKSTSSSNAKKEQAQVSSSSPKNPNLSDHPTKKAPSHGGASGPKPTKHLERKSSLRPVRPPMKKILAMPLCPKINASRATCSSTMKETQFPDHLDLNPGGTEAQGTSVFKVCPYTYCSLNGHRHAPLPPLRCFLSARRRLLKTQKSMKLRGLPSFRRTGPEKEEEVEMGAEQGVSSLVEYLGDDFFVEISTKCQTDASASVGGGGVGAHSVATDGTASAGDGGEDCEAEIEDVGSPFDDSGSQVSLEDSVVQISEFSPSEMEVLVNFLEFVECDSEYLPREDCGSWDCSKSADAGGFGGELAEEEGCYEPVSGTADMDWEAEDDGLYIDFDEIEYSEFAEDESVDGVSLLFDADGVVACNEDHHLGIGGSDEETVAEFLYAGGTASGEAIEAATCALEEDLMVEVEDMLGEQHAEESRQETQDLIVGSNTEPNIGDPCLGPGDGKNSNALVVDAAQLCQGTPADQTEDAVSGVEKLFDRAQNLHEEQKQGEVENGEHEASNRETETWESDTGGEPRVLAEDLPVESDDDKFGAPCGLSIATDTECPTGTNIAAAISVEEEEHTDTSDDSSGARAMVARRKKADGDAAEELRPFNPRAPNFLPVETDPEAEKVDLRHQLMDERKNSEEWMVDYALRQAVDKLAPGRKRKVALLVEAFETVTPVPPYGSSLGHSTVGFPHARPIQACS